MTEAMNAGEHGETRRRAGGGRAMAIGEAQTLAGELVQMRGGDLLGAVAAEIAPADVIAVDDDHVGLVLGLSGKEAEGGCEKG